ncbi:MAG: nucleotidyltransferase domain-containing protein [bacterium]|nr:nucleotidyltransferase domain-containing protein [bacterium]
MPHHDKILEDMICRLVDAFQPERIYLFGSRAREEHNSDSDYDLLLVIQSSDLPRYKREQDAFRILYDSGASKDIIVLTHDEFERKLTVATSLPATVEREGKLIYAA